MNRSQLLQLADCGGWSPAALDRALDLTGLAQTRRAWLSALTRLALITGALALGLALVFFIAYNWQAMGRVGRFALLQGTLLLAAGVGVWRRHQPAQLNAAMILAFMAVGVLLAFTGQTYQTGADTWELFAAWAVLGLPFVIAGWHGLVATLWLVVLNLALGLYFTLDTPFGRLAAPFTLSPTIITLVNALLWIGFSALNTRLPGARLGGSLALATALSASSVIICFHVVGGASRGQETGAAGDWLLWLTLVGGGAWLAWRHFRDIVALALIGFAIFVVFNTAAGRAIFELQASVISFNLMALAVLGSAAALGVVLTRAARALNARDGGDA